VACAGGAATQPGRFGGALVTSDPVVAIVGAGNLGGAVAAGLLDAGAVSAARLRCVTATDASAERLRERLGGAQHLVSTDAAVAVQGADVIMLGVKPPKVVALLTSLAPQLAPHVIIVSLAAGVGLAALTLAAPKGATVVRVMTNTPVRIRAATSLLTAPADVDPTALGTVGRLFAALGATHVVDESLVDVATALAGSGPAYLFLLAEVLRDAGVALGLDQDMAQAMAATTLEGAARLLGAGGEDPVALRAAVTSPGGMTAEAIAVLEAAELRTTMVAALRAAVDRAEELAQPSVGAPGHPPGGGTANP
jgi:pyrroline-5-carboxylate reductase